MCLTERPVGNKANDLSSENCELEGYVRRCEETAKLLLCCSPHCSFAPESHKHSTSRANNSDCPPQDPAHAQRPYCMTSSSVDPASSQSTEGGHQRKQPHVHIMQPGPQFRTRRTMSISREQLLSNPGILHSRDEASFGSCDQAIYLLRYRGISDAQETT